MLVSYVGFRYLPPEIISSKFIKKYENTSEYYHRTVGLVPISTSSSSLLHLRRQEMKVKITLTMAQTRIRRKKARKISRKTIPNISKCWSSFVKCSKATDSMLKLASKLPLRFLIF